MTINLQPKQRKIFNLLRATGPKVATIIGAGGAKGGGKSAGARAIALLLGSILGEKYSGIVITVVRRVAQDLRDNHLTPLFAKYPELHQYYEATPHDLVLPNHARIQFRSADTKEDVRKRFLGGFESAIIIVDEAQQFDGEELQWIHAACRWTNGVGANGIPQGLCKTLLLFNPGGPGGGYIRRVFWLRQYEGEEESHDFAFMHVFGWDNYEWFRGQVDVSEKDFYQIDSNCQGPNRHEERCCRMHMFITETSEGRKYNGFPISIRAGYLYGSFDHFEGQYFAGAWDQSLCCISTATASRIVQPWWTHWMAMDWGWAAPPRPHYSVCLWFAHGKLSPAQLAALLGIESQYPLDVVVVVQERHACLTPEPQWAQQVVDATPVHQRESMAKLFVDGAVFSKDRRSENTTADLMQPVFSNAGLPIMTPADKDRIGGWRQLYNALVRTCNARRQPVEEELEGPLLLVSADCPELCRALPLLVCDPDRPEDVLKFEAIEDDYGDTLRYGYKSMQEAQWQAPLEVRRREVYDTYDAPERSTGQMTNLAMRMRQFDADEKARYKRVKRRR